METRRPPPKMILGREGYDEFRMDTRRGCKFVHLNNLDSDCDERMKREDQMLHQTLTKIFRERCLTGEQIKKLLLASEHTDDQDFVIKLILKREPSLSRIFPKKHKLSLLSLAAGCCYQNTAELLVRSGADVNKRTKTLKITILHMLLRMYPTSWNDRFIALLLEHGADIHARNDRDKTPLHLAVEYGRVQVTEMLLEKGADVNAACQLGTTPLLLAARYRRICSEVNELWSLLLKYGADVTVRDVDGRNALHLLANTFAVEQVEAARVLIEKGASLDDREHRNQHQPIHFAVIYRKNELVKLFLAHGADVNARTADNYSPLHFVPENPTMLKILLEAGADVDLKTSAGQTALHITCHLRSHGIYENIKMLLSAGADVCITDHEGKTPFALIREKHIGNPVVKLMLKALALKACLRPSIELKDESIIKEDSEMWTYYQDCVEQIRKMKFTRFVKSCTFFELLTKCQCQIARRTRNPKFESGFRRYDLKNFSMYAEDIFKAFERVQRYSHPMLEQEDRQEDVINEAVYYILPCVVVRNVIRYIKFNCKVCELKQIVHASRSSEQQ